jgi:hypothetical protein
MQTRKRTLLVALLDIEPSVDEAEFNRWYNEEHVGERMRCPGFVSATRFQAVEGSPRYLVTYELVGPEALETPEYRSLIGFPRDIDRAGTKGSNATKKMVRSMRVAVRNVYSEIYSAQGESKAI